MSTKLMKGLLAVATLVLPAGSAFAFCMDGDVFTCQCPNGTQSVAYCENNRKGPCQCGSFAPVTEATPAKAEVKADEALVCEGPSTQPAPAAASTQS
ncbi:hypothetical protein JGU66_09835 [Myxococcaceae bacterium JPH2]|nr:hypothetical protein [Myxococcaceae bacterium JPH2]